MGRELKRVPMDFDWPIDEIWYGYYHPYTSLLFCHSDIGISCDVCKRYAKIKGIPIDKDGLCPEFNVFYGMPKRLPVDPPEGEGYQLWSTTIEGHPMSPVFATLDELCEWCEKNTTTFGYEKASRYKWKKMLEKDLVHHKEENAIFI